MRSQSGCRWQLLSGQPPFMAFNALSAIHLPISDHIPVIANKRKARTLIGRAQSAFTVRREPIVHHGAFVDRELPGLYPRSEHMETRNAWHILLMRQISSDSAEYSAHDSKSTERPREITTTEHVASDSHVQRLYGGPCPD